MTRITVNGAELYYEEHGEGDETIIFSHGLLWSGRMFHRQVEALKDYYRCITYDHRGQGRSAVTKDGYDIDTLTADVVALIDALDAAPCHFVGLSMGGFVALRLGIHHVDLLRSLILLATSADPEPEENVPKYRMLGLVNRWMGTRMVTGRVMPIMFSQSFLNDPQRAGEHAEWKAYMESNDRIGVTRALNGVINRESVYEWLDQIYVPTLIVVGDEDVVTVPTKSERMHARIPNPRLVTIPRAGHTPTVSEPEAVITAIGEFLSEL